MEFYSTLLLGYQANHVSSKGGWWWLKNGRDPRHLPFCLPIIQLWCCCVCISHHYGSGGRHSSWCQSEWRGGHAYTLYIGLMEIDDRRQSYRPWMDQQCSPATTAPFIQWIRVPHSYYQWESQPLDQHQSYIYHLCYGMVINVIGGSTPMMSKPGSQPLSISPPEKLVTWLPNLATFSHIYSGDRLSLSDSILPQLSF